MLVVQFDSRICDIKINWMVSEVEPIGLVLKKLTITRKYRASQIEVSLGHIQFKSTYVKYTRNSWLSVSLFRKLIQLQINIMQNSRRPYLSSKE